MYVCGCGMYIMMVECTRGSFAFQKQKENWKPSSSTWYVVCGMWYVMCGLISRHECLTSNQKILGSNPSWILSFFRIFNIDLASMLVDSVSVFRLLVNFT